MISDPADILDLINNDGIDKSLEYIDIEKIEDPTIRIIMRTIQESHSRLVEELVAFQNS
jgi:hypothetical protein